MFYYMIVENTKHFKKDTVIYLYILNYLVSLLIL